MTGPLPQQGAPILPGSFLDISPREAWVSANGLRFRYLEWGDASAPVAVLHHGSTATAHSWDAVGPALASRFRVIAYDMRNHGESDRGAFGSRAVLAEDLAAIADTLQIDRFALIGHSAGGGAAMNYAVQHAPRLTHLVLLDIGPVSPPAAGARARSGRRPGPAEFDTFADLIAWMRKIRPYASDAWLERQALSGSRPLEGGRYAVKYESAPPPEGAANLDLWPLLPAVTCPTLIIRAEESAILPPNDADRMVAILPDARSVLVPRAGHMVHEDNPEAVLEALASFFDLPTANRPLRL